MNIPITQKLVNRLEPHIKEIYHYGSRLFNVHTETSDYDIIKLYNYSDVFDINLYLPNIHSFQFSNGKEDIIYMTYEQFWNAFYNADGTLYADIILFSNKFNETALNMCKTYKIIKGYCGAAKRDLTTSGKIDKIVKRSAKNLYIAKCLLNDIYPDIKHIQFIYTLDFNYKTLLEEEINIRKEANDLFNSNKLSNYYIQETNDELLNIMLNGNNLKEYIFKK